MSIAPSLFGGFFAGNNASAFAEANGSSPASITDPWLPAPDLDGNIPSVRPAVQILVQRFTPGTNGATSSYLALPSVRCLSIVDREAQPSAAVFRYAFGDGNPDSPQSAEQALDVSYTRQQFPQLVDTGDRLVVSGVRPDGSSEWLFDGEVEVFNLRLSDNTEVVLFYATSVAKHGWDTPIGGALTRDSSAPQAPNDFVTSLVGQFNPRERRGVVGNATPSTGDVNSGGANAFPTFLDVTTPGTDSAGVDYPRLWTLNMAAAHLLFYYNAAPQSGPRYLTNPKRADLDALLVSRQPIEGTRFDPNDPSSYTAAPLAVSDMPLSGNAWPDVLTSLLKPLGFGLRFDLSADATQDPSTSVVPYLRQSGPIKSLYLAERGSAFTPTTSNLGAADLTRDLGDLANQIRVTGALKRYEVSFVLAPGYPSQPSDASSSNLDQFNENSPGYEALLLYDLPAQDYYRLWVLDEDGGGHYANGSQTRVKVAATSLAGIFPPDANGKPTYVVRPRKPFGQLVTTASDDGEPLRFTVAVSTDYAGSYPSQWDGTGTWQTVTNGVELLEDRVGIRVRAEEANGWHIGRPSATDTSAPFPSGVINTVESMATPSASTPPFFIRLTCVIESDQAVGYTAERQDSSPWPTVVTREVDARDRYVFKAVVPKSEFNNESGATLNVVRDDTELAKAEAIARRTELEAGTFGGDVMIPHITTYYKLGDRVDRIVGRGLGLRTDNGGGDFAPVLPVIVGRRFDFDGGQRMTLTLSDSGVNRRRLVARVPAPQRDPYAAKALPRSVIGGPTGLRGVFNERQRPRTERDNA